MTRTAILVAALLLLPIGATAQPMPQRITTTVQAPPRGITVTGGASVEVPATSITVTLQLYSATRAPVLDKDKLQPIVDALIKAGADPSSIRLPIGFGVPGATSAASITATIAHPTLPMLQNGITAVGETITSMKDIVLGGIQVAIAAQPDRCQAAQNAVRQQAIEHAHTKAQAIAKDLGVHLGAAINASTADMNSNGGSCSAQYTLNTQVQMNNPTVPQTTAGYLFVPVGITIFITYGIK